MLTIWFSFVLGMLLTSFANLIYNIITYKRNTKKGGEESEVDGDDERSLQTEDMTVSDSDEETNTSDSDVDVTISDNEEEVNDSDNDEDESRNKNDLSETEDGKIINESDDNEVDHQSKSNENSIDAYSKERLLEEMLSMKEEENCMDTLVHASHCLEENCDWWPSCQKMKRFIRHTTQCCKAQDLTCPICQQLIALCCIHANRCNVEGCDVLYCSIARMPDIKEEDTQASETIRQENSEEEQRQDEEEREEEDDAEEREKAEEKVDKELEDEIIIYRLPGPLAFYSENSVNQTQMGNRIPIAGNSQMGQSVEMNQRATAYGQLGQTLPGMISEGQPHTNPPFVNPCNVNMTAMYAPSMYPPHLIDYSTMNRIPANQSVVYSPPVNPLTYYGQTRQYDMTMQQPATQGVGQQRGASQMYTTMAGRYQGFGYSGVRYPFPGPPLSMQTDTSGQYRAHNLTMGIQNGGGISQGVYGQQPPLAARIPQPIQTHSDFNMANNKLNVEVLKIKERMSEAKNTEELVVVCADLQKRPHLMTAYYEMREREYQAKENSAIEQQIGEDQMKIPVHNQSEAQQSTRVHNKLNLELQRVKERRDAVKTESEISAFFEDLMRRPHLMKAFLDLQRQEYEATI